MGNQHFTNREKEIINEISIGKNSKEISTDLNISVFTVHAHRKNVMQKLNAKNTAHMIRISFEMGVLMNLSKTI
jgi:DNA-binding CsgD family transcriptional regulator